MVKNSIFVLGWGRIHPPTALRLISPQSANSRCRCVLSQFSRTQATRGHRPCSLLVVADLGQHLVPKPRQPQMPVCHPDGGRPSPSVTWTPPLRCPHYQSAVKGNLLLPPAIRFCRRLTSVSTRQHLAFHVSVLLKLGSASHSPSEAKY